MKSGFVNIVGKPNAGKSTLLNALLGEKLSIVSSKVQTTRHRIRAFLSGDDYQIVFSDTPGVIEPKYKLHEKMMSAVHASMEDADVCVFLADARDAIDEIKITIDLLKVKIPLILVLNKTDLIKSGELADKISSLRMLPGVNELIAISAKQQSNLDQVINAIIRLLPDGQAYYDKDELTDLPTKFFAAEIIREKIFELYDEEVPYQTTVVIAKFEEKLTLIKITAEIIVHRESQKAIILGAKGSKIKELGTRSRLELEKFLDAKVFLELFVKVRDNWRNNDLYLKEYGYN
ncbi:MAG: GTPase Era [Chitinophagaceae bacterium]|nr:GTPase Era [Chitinophagaceae bacterium]